MMNLKQNKSLHSENEVSPVGPYTHSLQMPCKTRPDNIPFSCWRCTASPSQQHPGDLPTAFLRCPSVESLFVCSCLGKFFDHPRHHPSRCRWVPFRTGIGRPLESFQSERLVFQQSHPDFCTERIRMTGVGSIQWRCWEVVRG